MKKGFTILIIILFSNNVFSQIDSLNRKYSFIIQDTPSRLFSMRQSNLSYISGFRILVRELNNNIKNEKVSNIMQVGLLSFFFVPATHEEGHRSILTGLKIGSISRPFFNSKGAAYVIGVTDQTLNSLRDNDLPNYIRLHTAGLESDYLLTSRVEDISIFQYDDFKNVKWEYWIRKLGIIQYFVSGLIGFESGITEEPNELDRDIVGYDTYGAARHLFRPDMNFYRYTRFDDLTSDEKAFVKRMGIRSLLNLLNPLIIGKSYFQISESIQINFGFGYTLAPFGDFIDENLWLILNNNINLKIYIRQFQNRNNWYYGGGIGIYDFSLTKNIWIDSRIHLWNQPKELEFHSSEGETGGAIEFDLRYLLLAKNQNRHWGASIDIGTTVKSKGFLPEELFMTEKVGVRFGTTLIF